MGLSDETNDLFENYEQQPDELQRITDRFSVLDDDDPYDVCREFLAAVEAIGYTFDYGLDGIPYDLRPMPKQ